MEVEPGVLNVWILKALMHRGHLFTNAILATLFVYQVDPVLLRVISLGFLHVALSSLEAFVKVAAYDYWRSPCQRGLHCPKHGYWSTSLKVRCYNKGAICFPECQDVFRFDEVSCVAFAVQTSHNKAPTHSTSIFPWYQYEGCRSVNRLNLHETINYWHSERRVLNLNEFFEHLVIEGELVDVVNAGWKASSQILDFRGCSIHHFFYSTLQALGQVNGVWKVERLFFLECFKHWHKLLVLWSSALKNELGQE